MTHTNQRCKPPAIKKRFIKNTAIFLNIHAQPPVVLVSIAGKGTSLQPVFKPIPICPSRIFFNTPENDTHTIECEQKIFTLARKKGSQFSEKSSSLLIFNGSSKTIMPDARASCTPGHGYMAWKLLEEETRGRGIQHGDTLHMVLSRAPYCKHSNGFKNSPDTYKLNFFASNKIYD
jgi:hypothetical protein